MDMKVEKNFIVRQRALEKFNGYKFRANMRK